MRSYPDINVRAEIVKAICELEVLGGYDRGYPEPGRYIEPLDAFVSFFAVSKAVDIMLDMAHNVNGLDGVVVDCDKDSLLIEYKDGSTAIFKRSDESNCNTPTM